MKRFVSLQCFAALLVAAIVGFSHDVSADEDLPFKGLANAVVTGAAPEGNGVRLTLTGTGLATHLGQFAREESVLIVDGVEYVLQEGQCVAWPSSHPHTMRNASDAPAIVVGFATEIVH